VSKLLKAAVVAMVGVLTGLLVAVAAPMINDWWKSRGEKHLVQDINGVLVARANEGPSVVNVTINQVYECKQPIRSAVRAVQAARDRRAKDLAGLGGDLGKSRKDSPELYNALVNSYRLSIEANDRRLEWLADERKATVAGARRDPCLHYSGIYWQAVAQADAKARKAKEAFVTKYDSMALSAGLRSDWEWDDI
jgi:hypothetical protein